MVTNGDNRATRGRLFAGAAFAALRAAPLALSLGVALAQPAAADTVVNPVQATLYFLGKYNPITFGAGTNINSSVATGVYGGGGYVWTVTNQGSITATSNGFRIEDAGTLTNTGLIKGKGNSGVYLFAGGSVTNYAGGTIIGGRGGVYSNTGAGTVTNAGLIQGTKGAGVLLSSGGMVANNASGAITGGEYGVYISQAATVTNAGLIEGGESAVVLGAGGKVANYVGGTITGGQHGVYGFLGAATVTTAAVAGSAAAVRPATVTVTKADFQPAPVPLHRAG